MIKYLSLSTCIILSLGCDRPSNENLGPGHFSIDPHSLMTLIDAEHILGQASHLADSVSEANGDIQVFRSTFTADKVDLQTGKTGNLYFMYEEYPDTTKAHEVYTAIKVSNEDHEGFSVLQDLGDEAYFHSDDENFYFILVRKGEKMFRIKVNKLTSKTSLEEFNSRSRQIEDKL